MRYGSTKLKHGVLTLLIFTNLVTYYFVPSIVFVFISVGNCPELIPPINGSIAYSINDTHVIAEYSCHTGYSLNGDIRRYCNDTGVWDGTSTSCVDDGESVYLVCICKQVFFIIVCIHCMRSVV